MTDKIRFTNGSKIQTIGSSDDCVRVKRKDAIDWCDTPVPSAILNAILKPFENETPTCTICENNILYCTSSASQTTKLELTKNLANELIYYDGDYYDLARLLIKVLPKSMINRLITKMRNIRKEMIKCLKT